ncbi:Auxin-responsive protein [Actinidia chinensis var. chinensis]|uniref:Auxin-responsive protein n=1 Tax=Actinidia chinensis var. chinensis TaxID=1590841 RepID=A0A2R6QI15_ACTCC|nr:Auxin-responsive protein [Actinidia chinensis var. chinensis]
MISPKKLIRMARKWQQLAAIRRKTISLPRANRDTHAGTNRSSSSVADKGHFVVYTADQRRFVFPIVYLKNDIFRELLKLSEEEFGLPSDGPITLPFDAVFMDYVVSLVQRRATPEIQKALLTSIQKTRCSVSYSLHQERPFQQLLVCSF